MTNLEVYWIRAGDSTPVVLTTGYGIKYEKVADEVTFSYYLREREALNLKALSIVDKAKLCFVMKYIGF